MCTGTTYSDVLKLNVYVDTYFKATSICVNMSMLHNLGEIF